MNRLFFLLIATGFAVAAGQDVFGGTPVMAAVTEAVIDAAKASVTLALGLIGLMALFLGLMKVAEAGGLLYGLARLLAPLMVRLFPDVPVNHPAMGAMILNMSANILGLNNAATPFGLRAMEFLQKLNPNRAVASNAQVLFLTINTASITILPTSVIALRAASGAKDATVVIAPALAATIATLICAIAVAKLLQRWFAVAPPEAATPAVTEEPPATDNEALPAFTPAPAWAGWCFLLGSVALVPLLALYGERIGPWLIPALLTSVLGWGLWRGVRIYDTFVEGAKEGFTIAVKIIPYLVAILVAIALFRTSGAMDLLLRPLAFVTEPLGLPAEALTMGLMRTVSSAGAFGLLADAMNNPAIGPDSFLGILLGVIYGSSENTMYVLAVYFGAVGIQKIRHALAAGLIADAIGLVMALLACRLLLG